MKKPLVSVIVPSRGDSGEAKRNLAPLQGDDAIELIVVKAEEVGRANRAHQMNAGACQARGEVLVFLHADTKIDRSSLVDICRLLTNNPAMSGGAFRFALDSPSWKARLVEFGVRLREIVFHLPYGDQAIFVRRSVFQGIGGYPEVPLLEDVLLIQKMKTKGHLLSFPKKAVTSARRWEEHGYLTVTLVNWMTMILWKTGVSLEKIARLRRRIFHGSVCGDIKEIPARSHTKAA